MEKQGIITGISNKITPQIDAVLNDFIVGYNTILKGLELKNGVLSEGVCQLCGYRGILEKSQQIDNQGYVYGKFVINFSDEEDRFSIYTTSHDIVTNVNPTSITSAGTYYLSLYENGVMVVNKYGFPKQAYKSDRAEYLIPLGTISSSATATTAPTNDNSRKVATTEYVHKQIEEELKVRDSGIIQLSNGATISIQRRADYCIATLTFPLKITVYRGTLNLGNMPDGYIPSEAVLSSIGVDYYDNLKTGQIKLDNAITLVNIPYSTDNESTDYNRGFVSKGTYKIGYECK